MLLELHLTRRKSRFSSRSERDSNSRPAEDLKKPVVWHIVQSRVAIVDSFAGVIRNLQSHKAFRVHRMTLAVLTLEALLLHYFLENI